MNRYDRLDGEPREKLDLYLLFPAFRLTRLARGFLSSTFLISCHPPTPTPPINLNFNNKHEAPPENPLLQLSLITSKAQSSSQQHHEAHQTLPESVQDLGLAHLRVRFAKKIKWREEGTKVAE